MTQVRRLAALETFGRIDILVNNAGTHSARHGRDHDARHPGASTARQGVRILRHDPGGAADDEARSATGGSSTSSGRPRAIRIRTGFRPGVTNAALMAMSKSVADAVARDNIRVNAGVPAIYRVRACWPR